MTRNEKIADYLEMKRSLTNPTQLYTCGILAYLDDFGTDTPAGHWLAHLLIERMVADGWEISMMLAKGCTVQLDAYKRQQDWNLRDPIVEEFSHDEWCFPTAVVELFCKVYDIPGGE